MLILYCETLLNRLVSSRSGFFACLFVFCMFLGIFYIDSPANKGNFISSLLIYAFISFSCLISLAVLNKNNSTVLNKNGDSRQLCLVLNYRERVFSLLIRHNVTCRVFVDLLDKLDKPVYSVCWALFIKIKFHIVHILFLYPLIRYTFSFIACWYSQLLSFWNTDPVLHPQNKPQLVTVYNSIKIFVNYMLIFC